jgi:outer membrane protein assembly factor BamD (BamD/ComL family)
MIDTTVSHYRVVERLGAGGMGVVYRAEDLRLGRHVALKFLPDSAHADPLAIERFQREARTASALNHPNICTIHDVGEHEGHRFLVMELIDGTTLDRVLTAGPPPIDRVVDISSQISDALDAAHSEGILHRDVKPGNVFITRRGQVKVVDFGLAKMMQPLGPIASATVTMVHPHLSTSAGTAVGTVAYMSPEHARGEPLDARSDLFSLGIVMYEMATGVQTFKGQTTAVVFDQILNRVPPPPSLLNPNVPLSLEHVIGRLLEKDRQLRYQTARDLHAELERLRRDMESRRFALSDTPGAASVAGAWAAQSGAQPATTATEAGGNVPTFPAAAGAVLTPPPQSLSEDVPTIFVPPPAARPASAGRPVSGPAGRASTTGKHIAVVPAADQKASAPAVSAPPPPAPAPGAAVAAQRAAGATVPAPRSRQPLSWRVIAGAAAVLVTIAGGIGLYVSQSNEVPIGASEAVSRRTEPARATPAPPPPAPAPAPPVAEPSAATAERRAPDPPAAAASAAPAVRPPAPTTPPVTTPAPTTSVRTPRPTTAAAQQAEAAKLLDAARKQLASGAEGDALVALASIGNTYATTPAGRDALALIAQTHHDAGRYVEAVGAWTDFGRRGGGTERASEGLIRAADRAASLRTPASDELARQATGELLTNYPSSVRALRALQMKMALEDRLKLRGQDPEFSGPVPASLLTLRSVARQGGTTGVAEFALWRLADEYKDRRLHELAATTYADLATRFPATRYDAWYSAAEIYEKQLRKADEARAAYGKVPPSSPNYAQAQKKAQAGS